MIRMEKEMEDTDDTSCVTNDTDTDVTSIVSNEDEDLDRDLMLVLDTDKDESNAGKESPHAHIIDIGDGTLNKNGKLQSSYQTISCFSKHML